jgi:hypothetical protein
MENTGDKGDLPTVDKEEYCIIEANNIEEEINELSSQDMKCKDGQDTEQINLINHEVDIFAHTLQEKLTQCTVKSLRELADYLDNIGSLANVVVAVRSGILNRSITVGSGILTFAVGISVPFFIAGASIGVASFISRAVGFGGGLIGTCLGVVGGVLTVVTAGSALPVVVAGFGMWFASGVAQWVGAGGGIIARGITLVGGAVMVFTASTAAVVCLCGLGLWSAIPAITREVVGSTYVETVRRDIEEDIRVTREIVNELDKMLEKELETEQSNTNIKAVRYAITNQLVVLHDGSPTVFDMTVLQQRMRTLVQDWKEGSGHIRVIADQLEDMIDMVRENNIEICHS